MLDYDALLLPCGLLLLSPYHVEVLRCAAACLSYLC